MNTLGELISSFFTHKDLLPPAHSIAGTLFTPLHLAVSAVCLAIVILSAVYISKKGEKALRTAYGTLWVAAVILEASKILWETYSGSSVNFEWGGILPLYPCSIFLYAMPFAVWGRGTVRKAACGYVCSLGLLGGAINFVYPANILSNYSCISFAGFHTLFFHGAIVFCALSMLISKYYKVTGITRWSELLIPSIPFLIVSVAANAVNFSPIGSDYMFFKLNSFIFAPLGKAMPDGLSVILVYAVYLFIHALPLLPSFIANKKRRQSI